MATRADTKNSGKLRQTLTELETALTSWDQIIPAEGDVVVPGAPAKDRPAVPDEMKKRTRELLNQLKEQIEDLSSDH